MRLIVSQAARRALRRLAADVIWRVGAAIDALAKDPRPPGCRLLKGRERPTWRIRVGDYRVLYEIDDAAGVVTVTAVRHRRDAYRAEG